MLCEVQLVSSWIWTRVAVSISYDDNHYIYIYIYIYIYTMVIQQRSGSFWNKIKYILCSEFFFHKCKLHIILELVYSKKYFNLAKIFVLKVFITLPKPLVAWTEICRQIFGCWELQTMLELQKNVRCIGRSMFKSKNLYSVAKYGFATTSLSRKAVYRV